MTASTRNRLIVIGLAALLVLVIVLFTVFGKKAVQPPGGNAPATSTGELGVAGDIDVAPMPDGLSPEEVSAPVVEGQTASRQIAELFSERYASYSNQGSYQNLYDLLPVMTPSYRAETQRFLDRVATEPPASVYEGYTAKKVSTEEIAFDDARGSAVYEISLQQVKTVGTSEPTIAYPTLRLEMERIAEEWKVDDAEWVK